MDRILLKSPATIANLSCGYDIFGICLEQPYDVIEIQKISSKEVVINSLDSPFSNIPTKPKENTGGVPAELIISDYSLDFGFEINIKKGIPLYGGLGSSSATAAGVAFGINKLIGKKISQADTLKYALEGENITSQTPHGDNIGACMLGGLVLVKNIDPIDFIKLPIGDLYFAIIHPDVKMDTQTSRKILPKTVELSLAVKQWANVASLTFGFVSNDIELIKKSMVDHIVEPIRSKLIPGYYDIKRIALKNGAIGCNISGSGPSIYALCENKKKANNIVKAMEAPLNALSINFHSYISSINHQGIKVIQ